MDELRTAHDDDAALYVGRCSFVGDAGASPVREHRDPSGAVFRWEDVTIDFRLTLPRDGAAFVNTAVAAPVVGSPDLKALFDRLGPVEGTALVATEYPGIRFRLELMLSVLTFHLGDSWLPGTTDSEHRVIPDPNRTSDDVAFVLPKVTFVYEQGDDLTRPPTFELASWGSGGFDAPHDLAAGEVVRMEPALAIHESGRVAFGVGQVVLDLSENSTPPEILQFFGVDQGWKGIYVRSARVFWSDKDKGWAVNVAVEDVLVSFAGQVSLEASLDVIGPEARMRASVHLFEGPKEVPYVKGTTTAPIVPGQATILNTGVIHVHLAGGVPPYVVQARLGSEELWNATTRQALVSPGGAAALRAPVHETLHVSVADSGTSTATTGASGTVATPPTRQTYLENIDLTVRGAPPQGAPRDGAPADHPPDRAARPDAVFEVVDHSPDTLPPGYDVTCTPTGSGLTERVVVSGPPGAEVTVGGVTRVLDATGAFSLDVAEAANIPIVVTWPDPPVVPPRQTFRLRFARGGPRPDLSDVGFAGVLPDYVGGTENPPDLAFGQSIPDGGPATPTGAAGLKGWIVDSVATGADAHITIDAHTAFVRPEDEALDRRLSERRLEVARAIILAARPDATFEHALAHGHSAAQASPSPGSAEHDIAVIQAATGSPPSGDPWTFQEIEKWITLPFIFDRVDDSTASHEFKTESPINTVAELRALPPIREVRRTATPVTVWESWDELVRLKLLRAEPPLSPSSPTPDPKFQVNLKLRLCYPTDIEHPDVVIGTGQPNPPKLPVVVIAHGQYDSWIRTQGAYLSDVTLPGSPQAVPVYATTITEHPSYAGFDYLQKEFARYGIVSVSVDCNLANFFNCGIKARADLIRHGVLALIADPGSKVFGRLDLDSFGFIGHSRGGDGVIQAVKDMRHTNVPITAKVVCGLATTDLKGSDRTASHAPLLDLDTSFYYALLGAIDDQLPGDAWDVTGDGIRQYDRATCPKAYTLVERFSHTGFNDSWWSIDDIETLGSAPPTTHRAIAVAYLVPLMRWKLKAEFLQEGQPAAAIFDGRATERPLGERASSRWSFGARVKVLDDFDNATRTSLDAPRTMTWGRRVADMSAVAIDDNTSMGSHSPHQGPVAYLDRGGLPALDLRFMSSPVPAAHRDWSDFDVLTFSLSAWYDLSTPASSTTPDSIARSPLPRVRIGLADMAAAASVVDWNTYGLYRPKRPVRKKVRTPGALISTCIMPLETVHVSLAAFTGIDLHTITSIAFHVDAEFTSHLFLADVALVKY